MKTSAVSRVYPLLIALSLALFLAGCATTATNLPPEEPAMRQLSDIDDEYVARVDDSWEVFNRSIYKFNYRFDKYVFLPVVNTYEFITPTFMQTGVSNFFNNIGEVKTLYNSLFQLKGEKALTTLGRFVTNTTIGLGGLFDPATSFGLARQDEDFGQTLGVWGVGTGPYVVLPILGPNTVRSTGGLVFDGGVRYALTTSLFNSVGGMSDGTENTIRNSLTAVETIDTRHKQPFRYYDSGYPFEYYMVRFLYREKRELAVMK
jgi:phospholipid-binding lipoprotein MlaA